MQQYNPENNTPAKFFTRTNLLLYVIIVLLIIFILYQGLGSIFAFGFGEDDVKTMRIILSFSQFMLILAPTLFFTKLRSNNLKADLRLKAPDLVIIFFSVLGIVSIQPVLQSYLLLQESIIDAIPLLRDLLNPLKVIFDMLEEKTLAIVRAHSIIEFITVVFVISVTPAICEEFLFRGFVLGNFLKLIKPFQSLFLSGFLFALYHFQPFNLVPLIILGFYLGYVVYFSGSLWTGVICHFVNNLMASYFLYISGKEDFDTPDIIGDRTISTLIITIISLILFITVLISIYRYRRVSEIE